MSISQALFSSKTEDWETPQDLFNELNKIHNFDIDVCATKNNSKCQYFYHKEDDALSKPWNVDPYNYGEVGKPMSCWMNPPYGKTIGQWIKKAYEESKRGATVVCLLPSRTDTKWFHEYCQMGKITFIEGRLKFSNSTNSAPFPSMVVVFKGETTMVKKKKEDSNVPASISQTV